MNNQRYIQEGVSVSRLANDEVGLLQKVFFLFLRITKYVQEYARECG